MRKLFILISSFFVITTINAQEKRTILKGKVVLDSLIIADVHVINTNTDIGTITNDNGYFEIPVKLGDSLLVSHINLQEKFILITDKILSDINFTISINEKTYTLNEFTLEKPRSIFYQDKEITTYNGPVVNAETLRLPFANTKVEKDNSIVKFKSGGVVSIDNLINSINGNNKRQKLLKKLVDEDDYLLKIRKKYTDDFFITDLKIKKEYINQFLNYCVDKNIISIFKNENSINLTKLLIREGKDYPHKILNENLFLTKK
ncbi:hypothetical protein H9W90_05330 [Polaribacter pectinis]|uniref:CarboxypepD_reg-like domain-containing protein n=1 Tax=Polaribacter pectinis TaxID=2738844 RepID=A0A7G9LD43_9FLAO|nr:hypothetical protein [Polaribacter pectinis]QNM86542.1 hypothetical protein H9W90_05330 [Polaribacter pectinis]